MEREQNFQKNLIDKFGFMEGKINITRERRIFAQVPREDFMNVLEYAAKELGFTSLCTITGLDTGDDFQFIYHLAEKKGVMLNLKQNAPKSDPVIKSVTPIFNGAIFYEKELIDLLGVSVDGLPKGGRRYPLPDGWPEGQYPLRKDWKPEMLHQKKAGPGNGENAAEKEGVE
jgi:membrane-bound hydrogenase subunit beta